MSRPENTADRDPAVHALGLMGGSSRYITEMEAAGQQQLVHSDVLPTEGPWDQLEALGFIAGDVDPQDPLFRRCTLPEGWARQSSDHTMWSYIVDDRGLVRVSVFYKAAFYDRRASVSIPDVGHSLAGEAIYGTESPELPARWDVMTADEKGSFTRSLDSFLLRAAEHPDVYADRADRARAIKKLVQS